MNLFTNNIDECLFGHLIFLPLQPATEVTREGKREIRERKI